METKSDSDSNKRKRDNGKDEEVKEVDGKDGKPEKKVKILHKQDRDCFTNSSELDSKKQQLPLGVYWFEKNLDSKKGWDLVDAMKAAFEFKAMDYRGKPMPRPKAPFIVKGGQNKGSQDLIPLYRFPGMTFKSKKHPPYITFDKAPALFQEVVQEFAPDAITSSSPRKGQYR